MRAKSTKERAKERRKEKAGLMAQLSEVSRRAITVYSPELRNKQEALAAARELSLMSKLYVLQAEGLPNAPPPPKYLKPSKKKAVRKKGR
jgi:hypothetical protein